MKTRQQELMQRKTGFSLRVTVPDTHRQSFDGEVDGFENLNQRRLLKDSKVQFQQRWFGGYDAL
jgi:hypothetical protein